MKKFVSKKSMKSLSLALSLSLVMSSSQIINIFGSEQTQIVIDHTNDMHVICTKLS